MISKLFLLSCFSISSILCAQMPVQLAVPYADGQETKDFLVSEKLDGVRAIWTGHRLLTRRGNPIHAPSWFTAPLPDVWLDGELWSGRGEFQFIASVVAKQTPNNQEWQRIHYMVFDAPDYEHTFIDRSLLYERLVEEIDQPFINAIKQFTVADTHQLSLLLDEYIAAGAEGLILHRKTASFTTGRSGNVFKLKPYMDAEAMVVGITQGKGKYQGMMGALKVEMPSGLRFKIGSGFSDQERRVPPNIGDQISYKYHGLTDKGIPRFASFLRIRRAAQVELLPE